MPDVPTLVFEMLQAPASCFLFVVAVFECPVAVQLRPLELQSPGDLLRLASAAGQLDVLTNVGT